MAETEGQRDVTGSQDTRLIGKQSAGGGESRFLFRLRLTEPCTSFRFLFLTSFLPYQIRAECDSARYRSAVAFSPESKYIPRAGIGTEIPEISECSRISKRANARGHPEGEAAAWPGEIISR